MPMQYHMVNSFPRILHLKGVMFAAARALLFQFLQPDTPLIAHAIENDLNTCRIIHPAIIDTVPLYSHSNGPPIRHGLKHLSKKVRRRQGP